MNIKEIKSKELYNLLTQEQKNTLPVLRIHYKDMNDGTSIWEDGGLIKAKEIKQDVSLKVFSIRYNRKNLLKHAIKKL